MKPDSPTVRIFCFGGFRMEGDGSRSINFSTDKSRALLVYLAVESGRTFRRSHLASLLWSEVGEEQALHNLRQTLSLLRKAWDDLHCACPLIQTERDTIQLNPLVNCWVDVCAFDEALGKAYQHFHNRRDLSSLNIRQLLKASLLFNAPFLDRFELDNSPLFDEWALAVRERTSHAAAEALALLCEVHERRGEYSWAADTARKIITLTPWDESAHTRLMRLLAVDGHWSAAQNQYVRLKQYLKRNLEVEPEPQTIALDRQIRSAAAANRPFPPQLSVAPHSLPVVTAEFVGRERELDEIGELLSSPQVRLLTLAGMGGIGKTHLALETGRLLVGLFRAGVFFIPLLNINSNEAFLTRLASGIGLQFSENVPHAKQILDYLREKQLLLVLDNFDHLLEDPQSALFITEILQHAPGVKVVVTSRERLNLQEEYVILLDGLSFPLAAALKNTLAHNYEAVLLFEKRARKSSSNFRLDAENEISVLRICSLMQGHPLGIELVASLTTNQTCADLLGEIENGIHRLESQFANAPVHHKTLRAVFDTSWSRLMPAQQFALGRLAVCRGGFSEQAAAEIAKVDSSLLASLAEKSLLRQNQAGRYDFHEAVRQYAEEKLNQTGQGDQARDAHTHYYIQKLKSFTISGEYSNQQTILNWVELEYENIRAAWNCLIVQRQTLELNACVDLLYQFFNIRSRFSEGIAWFEQAMAGAGPFMEDDQTYAILQSRVGSLALRARLNSLAWESLSASQATFLRTHNHRELAFCLVGLGGYHLRKKAYVEAQRCAQESLTFYHALNDLSGQSYALYLSGLVYSRVGNYPAVKEALHQALALSRQIGDRRRFIAPLNVLGDTACTEGDYETAEKYFLEGLQISRELNDRFNQAILLNNLSSVYQSRAQFAKEEAVLLESLEICRDIGDLDGEAFALNNLGEMAVALGKYHQAIEYDRQALKIAYQLEEDWTIIVCLNTIGEAYFGLEDYPNAGRYFQLAVLRSLNIQALDLLARAAVNAGIVYFLAGESQTALELLQAALAHSAVEYEARQKAVAWLEKMGADGAAAGNDDLLAEVAQKVYQDCSLDVNEHSFY